MTSVVRCLLGQQSQLHLYHEAKCLEGAMFIPSPEAGSKNPVGNAAAYCQQHVLHKAHHKSGACMVLGKECFWGKHALKPFPAHLALIEPEGQYFVHVGSQGIRQCVQQGAAHKGCQHCQEQAAENVFTACSATAVSCLTSVRLTRLEVGMWCSKR